jgi:hypothetical protein
MRSERIAALEPIRHAWESEWKFDHAIGSDHFREGVCPRAPDARPMPDAASPSSFLQYPSWLRSLR